MFYYLFQKKKTPDTKPIFELDAGVYNLRNKNTVAENLIVANSPLTLAAAISTIALYGINNSVLHSLDNASMIRKSVLWTGFAVRTIPIVKDNHSR